MPPMYRAQILLEPDQHRALSEISRRERRSISDVVRQILRAELERLAQDTASRRARQLLALEQLQGQWDRVMAQRQGSPAPVDTVELINQMREEQDDRTLRGFDSSD